MELTPCFQSTFTHGLPNYDPGIRALAGIIQQDSIDRIIMFLGIHILGIDEADLGFPLLDLFHRVRQAWDVEVHVVFDRHGPFREPIDLDCSLLCQGLRLAVTRMKKTFMKRLTTSIPLGL